MTNKPPDDEPQEKHEEFNEDKFTWHEGDVQIVEDQEKIRELLQQVLDRRNGKLDDKR